MSRRNILVVDFDYFFPNPLEAGEVLDGISGLYDWGHREAPFFIEGIWPIRASQFLAAGLPLPRAVVPEGWWSRFRLTQQPTLLLCDSNAHAGNLLPDGPIGQVWLFDAHHDAGYGATPQEGLQKWNGHRSSLNCEDWMLNLYHGGADLHMRYPQWRANGMDMEPEPAVPVDRAVDDLAPLDIRFHTVLMCRSGAWVPSWCDPDFTALADAYPGRQRWLDQSVHPRAFDAAAAQGMAGAYVAMAGRGGA